MARYRLEIRKLLCKGLASKYFKICRPNNLWANYSILSSWCTSSQRCLVKEQTGLWPNNTVYKHKIQEDQPADSLLNLGVEYASQALCLPIIWGSSETQISVQQVWNGASGSACLVGSQLMLVSSVENRVPTFLFIILLDSPSLSEMVHTAPFPCHSSSCSGVFVTCYFLGLNSPSPLG